ncbi:hypothetical protein BW723_00250 [Polaribacter reichenbachii]|uniref:Uncharacterized protein n=1 Tax=Polaribacter reichenbachii TaxID=996801 RepID=A0A1B8U2C3_9FLAO|nr:hypothetical protein [Polaribacter reichenbachii]APZ44814.1 hypothetical protein BW723_00250 [Polaribacter reichenbachii]AUC18678.1 hypothetical protein BTO17_08255 [Polaribacter reichenbachii]OBY66005.1 hypothetical protein LPB301_07470 [Polaribacter reichenbachii]
MKISASKIFILSGLINIVAVLILSRFFTNVYIPKYDATVMSNFGLLMIVLWGFTYISVAKSYKKVKWIVAVFAIEKLIYGIIWVNWQLQNNVSPIFEEDLMAGIFFSIYGINDILFFIFFTIVFIKLFRNKAI